MNQRPASLCRLIRTIAVFVLMLAQVHAEPARRVTFGAVAVELQGVGRGVMRQVVRVVEDQLEMAGDSVVSPPLADDLAFFLRSRYWQLGFADVQVEWAVRDGVIVLTVEEGVRHFVGAVNFTGVEPATHGELTSFLLRPTREREWLLARRLPFVETDLRAGLDLVLRHLRAGGHLDARADDLVFTRHPDRGVVDVSVDLHPGPMSTFGAISLRGDTAALGADLKARAVALATKPYNEVVLESTRAAVVGGLQELGYFLASVEASTGTPVAGSTSGSIFPVTFVVAAGRQFSVRAVEVDEGMSRGASRVARSVFSGAAGQTYSPQAIDMLHRRALDTGLFSRLDAEPSVVGEGVLDLRIGVEEAKPKTLGFYGGYESLLGPILGLEARHVNFMDTGNSVAFRAEGRGAGGEGGLLWNDPAIFGTRWSLGTGVSWESFTFKDYDRQTAAWRSTLTRRLTRRITAEGFGLFTQNEMTTDALSPEELGPDDYSTASGGARLTFDYRDHPLQPRTGWLLSLYGEGGLIDGDQANSFVRTDVEASWHLPLAERWRFSVGAKARVMVTPAKDSEIPIDLRLFNGGSHSVRSFAEREMGPFSVKGDTPLGGLATGVASAELSYLLVRNLELAAFFDAGSLGPDASAFFKPDDWRYAVGMGLRYRLPVGPLRIDYGVNPDRHPGESFGAFHFTFGFAF
jgi:outer membrane protein insertion porin family